MSKRKFKDPITGAWLTAFDMDTDVPVLRMAWGRKLGFSDDEIHRLFWEDKRSPRFVVKPPSVGFSEDWS